MDSAIQSARQFTARNKTSQHDNISGISDSPKLPIPDCKDLILLCFSVGKHFHNAGSSQTKAINHAES
jgi:hypothetical protein